ncbi:PleD family two-component system response regulator, partial [Sulfitobacter sp. M22298]
MSPRIIAVDDSDIAQDFISATLSELGFDDVVSFIDPRSALDAIESDEATADLILMDIMMPDIDGIELCARIRALDRWSDVPIIMLTSRTDMGSLSEAFMAGANDYVTKPFNRIELQARMRSCLRLKSELDRRRLGENRSARRRAAPGVSEATVP